MERIRVLVADDHALFRRGVTALLAGREDMEVVGEAADGEEAIERARELMPDVILMDIKMPGVDGLAATRRIKAEMPYVKILMLTVSETDEDLFEAIKAGASGYLLKNVDPEYLVACLRQAQRGEVPIAPTMASKILRELAAPPEPAPPLTARERQVLELLAAGKSNKEIALDLKISENTVKNHLRNILEKLHLQNRVQAALYAVRMGLVPPPGEPPQPSS
ncbi:MAG: response regulator transcription factor [Armatimonadota bacterium]|nr:response regulator transcription factor [Armatimonadota bacterium]MDR7402225.1 response regulator transcription factor [Armatimonadota bacterium]MDR7403353.1 response regulator transcription factor [Armatimonadota bacterium]MDR7436981.1 response regulator transcription factor [Armatimonadota bacterium]MDR7472245.1 response regulator transcription factor [Armatimonadota bacterium]